MKQIFTILFIITVVVEFSLQAQAELFNRGMDSLGNRLIYDTDLNITWYDYTKSYGNWQTQMNWADGLDIDFGGTHYTDWRLPTTVDGPSVWGYDGTTTAGYNITSSEMGHLFYTELGNKGWYNTSGSQTGCIAISCLKNTGDFQHLQPFYYWSGTENAASTFNNAWLFGLFQGVQGSYGESGTGSMNYAIAVRAGDVAVVPEPISSILFLTGGILFAGRSYLKRKKKAYY